MVAAEKKILTSVAVAAPMQQQSVTVALAALLAEALLLVEDLGLDLLALLFRLGLCAVEVDELVVGDLLQRDVVLAVEVLRT